MLNEQLFSETDDEFIQRIRNNSPYGHLKTWSLSRMIIKSNDDLRSEQFAMQVIETIDLIFKKRHLKLKLTPYEIISTGPNCGIVEFVSNAMSIDYIKRKMTEKAGRNMDLVDFYKMKFGEPSS